MPDEFTVLTEETARKIQLRLLNKLYEEMKDNPSASLFAVVERQLARLNMGLIDLPDSEDMTTDEKTMLDDFEKMSADLELDSDDFSSMQ